MNPEHVWKAACAVGAAIAGIFVGREVSKKRHQPIYKKQYGRAKLLNAASKRKRYNS